MLVPWEEQQMADLKSIWIVEIYIFKYIYIYIYIYILYYTIVSIVYFVANSIVCIYIYTVQKFGVNTIFFFFKEVSNAPQGWIYLIKIQ